jgi:hypothetical protein
MNKESGHGMKWITALMLSPGVIFSAAYLVVWLLTNVYLDHTFKELLKRSFISATGRHYRLNIASLSSGPALDTITLKQLELIPLAVAGSADEARSGRQIAEIEISCPDLGFLFFRPAAAKDSTQNISLEILSRCQKN